MELKDLVPMIMSTPFSLFLGAGSSLQAGGPNGANLIRSIKNNFGYSGEGSSFFYLMDNLVGDDPLKRSKMERVVKDFLSHIGPTDTHRFLFSLPWRAVLTTNYDKLPEAINTTLDGTRSIKVIVSAEQDTNMLKPDILYCFKLFGDVDISYPARGAIVLTNADRRQAYFQGELFKHFFELAASGNVLYVGYSFEDELVFDVLSDMTRAVNRSMWPGYMITPNEPPPQIREKLQTLHIEWVKGTLEQLITESRKLCGQVPKSSYIESSPIIIHQKSENCKPYLGEIKDLHNYLKSSGKPVDIILVERNTAIDGEKAQSTGIDMVLALEDSIDRSEGEQFLRHFSKLGLISDSVIARSNIQNPEINTSFFALLYTSINSIQETLRGRIHDEYNGLEDNLKTIYSRAAVFRIYDERAYLSLFSKVCNLDPYVIVSYLRNIKIPFLSIDDETSEIQVNLRIIADIIAEKAFQDTTDLKIILTKIIESVNYAETNQLHLLHDLVIERIGEQGLYRPFSFLEKEEIFMAAISVVRTGLLLHHLAILYLHNKSFAKCSECIAEAYTITETRKYEPVEFIKDTEGRLEIALATQNDTTKDESIKHLQRAEGLFKEAIISEAHTPHPYAGLAETYLELAKLSDSLDDKRNMLANAISSCSTYLNSSSDLNIRKFNFLQRRIFSEFDRIGFDVTAAKNLAIRYKNANGYAYLADKKVRDYDDRSALDLVNEGLTYEPGSSWLNLIRIRCVKKLWPGDLELVGDTLEKWERNTKKPYQITLKYELAKYRYIRGQEKPALELFGELSEQMFGHPSRIVVDRRDLWKDGDLPKEFKGN